MNWQTLIESVGPVLISLLKNASKDLGSPLPPTPDSKVPQPIGAIKALQHFLNLTLSPEPPLVEDGWLGPRTELAIEQGIAKLQSMGIGT